jgi:hypothetical protein
MDLEKALRPAYRKCYVDAFKKNPNAEGTIQIAVNVDGRGRMSSARPTQKSELGDAALDCMVKATKAIKFDLGSCPQKTLTIVHKYPR